jgi:hypothetical protein
MDRGSVVPASFLSSWRQSFTSVLVEPRFRKKREIALRAGFGTTN